MSVRDPRLADAFAFALEAHGEQTRKQSEVPYVSHLLQVAGLVLAHGGDVDQAIAALLHDVLEDCAGVDAAALRERFGAEPARIVEACSDLLPGDRPDRKSPWLDRKRAYLAQLRSADARVRLVAACDKLDNLRALLADLDAAGPATLERFSGSPRQLRWFYEAAHAATAPGLPERLRAEVAALLVRLAEHVPEASCER